MKCEVVGIILRPAPGRLSQLPSFQLLALVFALVGWLSHSCAIRWCLLSAIYSLVYFGGLVRSFLVLLATFGGLTKKYSSALLGGATPVSWLSWPGAGLFGWLGGFRSSGPLLLAVLGGVGACVLVSLIVFDGASARELYRIFGGFFDGPEGHAVLLQYPA